MRKESRIMKNIRYMYHGLKLNPEEIYHKAKLLLSVYRDVVWSTTHEFEDFKHRTSALMGSRLDEALAYLNVFAPTEQRQAFERRVSCLFETKWMVELVDNAMVKVYNYPKSGSLYFEILSKCYLSAFCYTESEVLEITDLERSVYYDRKREAVMLLGVALWGYTIPQFRGIFHCSEPSDSDVPVYFRANPD